MSIRHLSRMAWFGSLSSQALINASTSARLKIFGSFKPLRAAAILRLGSAAIRFSATQKR